MRILGLTGSIAMGKSIAAAMLRRMGVAVHDADAVVHTLTRPGGAAIAAIAAAFPDLVRNGALDRASLSQRAFEAPGLWAGLVETSPGAVSGWHHHDRNETCIYVISGVLRLEVEGGAAPVDAGPGDFVRVPAHTVHRESNPTDEPSFAVIARAGGAVPTVNVDAPA